MSANHSALVFPSIPAQLTGQTLVSHAGLSALTRFLNTLDIRRFCMDRFSQFAAAPESHRPGKILGAPTLSLAASGDLAVKVITDGPQRRLLIPSKAPEAQLLCQLQKCIDTSLQRWRQDELATCMSVACSLVC